MSLNVEDYDAMVVAGGQGPMFTFESAENLHRKFSEFYESDKVTAALCPRHRDPALRQAVQR